MTAIPTSAFPLAWPQRQLRTKSPARSRFKDPSIAVATKKLKDELDRMRCTHVVISSNLRLKPNGDPYSDQRLLATDCGVALYFLRQGTPMVIAADQYDRPGCNLQALAYTVEAMRGIERWGCTEMLNQMFTGFKLLGPATYPATTNGRPWHEVLGCEPTDNAFAVKECYRNLVTKYHPDKPGTGDAAKFHEVQVAWETFKASTNG